MNKSYAVWFHFLGLSEKIKVILLDYFGDFKKIYEGTEREYTECGLTAVGIKKIEAEKKNLEKAYAIIERCNVLKIEIVSILDKTYPCLLREIHDPPMVLFVKGEKEVLNTPILGIVGSRDCTEYGLEATYNLAKTLAEYGLTIISGMALGIDEAAHKGALKVGKTIAVLGTGLTVCYPKQNRAVYEEIPVHGCLVSEYDLSCPPMPYQFPKRNRIISGMALGVLVTQAGLKSGSLITAHLALEQGREVYALPGTIDSRLSKGTHELIKTGAQLVTEAKDIIEQLPAPLRAVLEENKKNTLKNPHDKLAQDERIVYAYLSREPILIKELMEHTKLSYEIIYMILIKLENKGLIKKMIGERYRRA